VAAASVTNCRAMGNTVSQSLRHRIVTLLMLAAAAACYVGVVAVRHGPAPAGDTGPLTSVTTDLSTGDLHAAAANASLPNPPGYPLLASPFVAVLRSTIGSPTWCSSDSRIVPPPRMGPDGRGTVGLTGEGACGTTDRNTGPAWYRSQGVLGVLAWLVLAVGALALLRAGRADTLGRTAGLLVFLAVLPSASSAIVQLYHPQDVVSLGLALGGLAQALRQRWIPAGLLFGVAILTKQFAILLLLPALASAPDRRARAGLLVSATAVFAAGLLPFLVSAPDATVANFTGTSGGGALAGATVLTQLGATGNAASAVARDAPVVFAVVACIWARQRLGRTLARPETLVGLTLACVGSRLVFESVLFPYYLLATSVIFFQLDLVARRSPHRSLTWCAAAAFFVALRPGNRTVDAVGTLLLAATGVVAGLAELRRTPVAPAAPGPPLVPSLPDEAASQP
jgi:Glycosyltransferase family 87